MLHDCAYHAIGTECPQVRNHAKIMAGAVMADKQDRQNSART